MKIFIILQLAAILTVSLYFSFHKMFDKSALENSEKVNPTIILNNKKKKLIKELPQRPEWPDIKIDTSKPKQIETFDWPHEDWRTIKVTTPNRQPLIRIPPVMPSEATKSGQCTFSVLVSAYGGVNKIKSLKCSADIFKTPTKKAVMKWKFQPKIIEGKSIPFESETQIVKYDFINSSGITIPE